MFQFCVHDVTWHFSLTVAEDDLSKFELIMSFIMYLVNYFLTNSTPSYVSEYNSKNDEN